MTDQKKKRGIDWKAFGIAAGVVNQPTVEDYIQQGMSSAIKGFGILLEAAGGGSNLEEIARRADEQAERLYEQMTTLNSNANAAETDAEEAYRAAVAKAEADLRKVRGQVAEKRLNAQGLKARADQIEAVLTDFEYQRPA